MIENVKAFVADIDGTLAEKGEDLLPRTKAALEKMHEEGILVGIASGRPCDARTLENAQRWGLSFDFDVVIGMNGGDLYMKGSPEFEHFHLLKKRAIKKALDLLDGLYDNAIVYKKGYDHVLCTRMDWFMEMSVERNHSLAEVVTPDKLAEEDTGKLEIHYDLKNHDKIMEIIAASPDPDYTTCITFQGTVEFLDPHVDKGLGIRMFAERAGISPEEIIAFGDEQNDYGMLRDAGWGVCLKNGCEQCKEVADDITECSVTEDGVGRYLEKHLFKEPLLPEEDQ